MGLTREQVEKLLEPIEKLLDEGVEKMDAAQVASGYAETAALIHLGQSAITTRAAIEASYKSFFTADFSKMELEKTAAYDVNNGEYLMRKGRYRMTQDGPWFRYMQLFERQPDQSYLLIHDEFEYTK